MDHVPAALAALSTAGLAQATSDETQTLIVALLALIVREVIYWWRNRRKP